jgi:hypothetical protein
VARQLEAHDYLNLVRKRALPPAPVQADKAALPAQKTLKSTWLNENWIAPAKDGAMADIWDKVDGQTASKESAHGGSEVKAKLTVQSLWSADGLYFRFAVEEASWAPATDALLDTVDFHLTTLDPVLLGSDDLYQRENYIMPEEYSLLKGAVQMQVPFGNPDWGKRLYVNFWDPLDPQRTSLSAGDDFGGSGIWLDPVVVNRQLRSLELFLPWRHVGFPGLAQAPDPGTRLSFVLLYNDSASETTIAWPSGRNPWAVRPGPDKESPFGQLLLSAE